MKYLPIFVVSLLMLCTFGCGSKHKSTDSDNLAQYRDTLIGNFNGLEIDTLICEPMDSLNPNYKGFHYKWRVFTKNKTIKDLILENKTIGIHFVKEGDLDGNGTDEFGVRREAGTWDNYCVYTYDKGEWKYLIKPILTYSDHFYTDLNNGKDVVERTNQSGLVRVRFSDINPLITSPIESILHINDGKTKYGTNLDILTKAYKLINDKENSPFNKQSYNETLDWICDKIHTLDPKALDRIKQK